MHNRSQSQPLASQQFNYELNFTVLDVCQIEKTDTSAYKNYTLQGDQICTCE